MAQCSPQQLHETMVNAAVILRGADIRYALAGGLAVWVHGGPDVYHDVDFLILEEDKDRALEAFEDAGFRTEKPAPEWLYKAYQRDCLVDLIFKTSLGSTQPLIERSREQVVLVVRM